MQLLRSHVVPVVLTSSCTAQSPGGCARVHQGPSAFHILSILGGGRSPHSDKGQDPEDDIPKSAGIDSTVCLPHQRSSPPGRSSDPVSTKR